jgi:hypothetical protein
MCSKVRMIALAFALALGAEAARALRAPAHRAQLRSGLVDAARTWTGSWFGHTAGGQLAAIKGKDGVFIDPNGYVITTVINLLTTPKTTGGTPVH